MRKSIVNGELCSEFVIKNDLIYFKDRLWLVDNSVLFLRYLKNTIVWFLEAIRVWNGIRNVSIWKGMRLFIKIFVDSCVVCQRMKIPRCNRKDY